MNKQCKHFNLKEKLKINQAILNFQNKVKFKNF